jgi:uncharacterized protein
MTLPRALIGVLAATIMAACATGGSSTAAPASRPASSSEGRFVWQDLVTTDSAAARKFYGALLGWEFTETNRGGRPYLIARTAAGPVGGLIDVRDIKGAESQWVSYVSVADMNRSVQQVQTAGGKIIVPPTAAAAGQACVVADPQGAALGLLKPSAEPPADPAKPVPAHFFWREYLAQDATKALDFYKGLLGYDTSATDSKLGIEYFVLRRDSARAGLFQIPAAAVQVRPHWLPYILVDDPSAMTAKATGLGGRILLEPSPDRRNGTLAIIADSTGGVVALQKFPI